MPMPGAGTARFDPLFAYQKNNRYFAEIAEGLEPLGAEELTQLGAEEIQPTYRGLYFSADRQGLYRINYLSRLCSRILAPLLRFDCHDTRYLYKTAIRMPWHQLLDEQATFAVAATTVNSRINHSQYAALCLKDAVADYFRQRTGSRPNVDTENPQVLLNLHIDRNKATISLDTSGGSLHRRGYRQHSVEAPMQETVAAAMIKLSGWQGEVPLVDPFCGSGTILLEALMHFCRLPSAFLRQRFGFEMLPDFDAGLWQSIRGAADSSVASLPAQLLGGSDIDDRAIAAARANCTLLPGGDRINLEARSFQEIPAIENQVIVSNPPYGIRLGSEQEAAARLKEFGDFLKRQCRGSTAYLYFGNREMLKRIGLRPSWKKGLKSGGLDGVLAKYELY